MIDVQQIIKDITKPCLMECSSLDEISVAFKKRLTLKALHRINTGGVVPKDDKSELSLLYQFSDGFELFLPTSDWQQAPALTFFSMKEVAPAKEELLSRMRFNEQLFKESFQKELWDWVESLQVLAKFGDSSDLLVVTPENKILFLDSLNFCDLGFLPEDIDDEWDSIGEFFLAYKENILSYLSGYWRHCINHEQYVVDKLDYL